MGTRKVLSGAVLLLVGLAITLVKGDIPVNLLSLMQWIYSAFVLGNIGEHASNAYGSLKNRKKGNS